MWKKSSLKILTLVLAAALLITLINWFVDPFMKFRVNKNLKYFYTNANERYINSGIAKHMEYNTAIVGTSMVENFSITDVNALMHTKSVKLPFSGGSAQEFSILVNHLLAQDKADTIIYGLDYFAYKNMLKSDDLKGSEPPFPHEMYDDSLLSNLKYLIAYNTLKQTWNVLQNSYYTQRSKSYLHAFCWYQECHFNAQVVEDFWQEREETDRKNKYDKKDFNFLVLKKNFDTHTLSIIQAHPNIHFIIFLPP